MAKWTIDTTHSEVGFKVKHLVISTVSGKFNTFEGTVESDKNDFTDAKINFTADVNSITTGNEQRDGHLKSDDFFNAEQFPKLTFSSTSIVKKDDSDYELTGDLTIRDVTKPITLKVEFGGIEPNFYGNTVAAFELTGKINRKEYGLKWHAATEAGGLVVSDDVKLAITIEITKANA